MKKQIFELAPINGRASFYNKARVEIEDNISFLYSYNTKVAEYNHITNKMNVYGWYSKATSSHINAFLDFYGFDTVTKKEMENYDNNKRK